MLLTVDIGNTRFKWALWRDGRVSQRGAAPLAGEPQGTEWRALEALERPRRLAIAGVADPGWIGSLVVWAEKVWGCDIYVVETTESAFGLQNGYRLPGQLGVDRWAALVAAWYRWRRAIIVVDAGTACTLDAVNDAGCHLGGYIVPGVARMSETLVGGTHGVRPQPEDVTSDAVWGCSTRSGLVLGAAEALRGLVERAASRLERTEGHPVAVVLTGGDAETVSNHLGLPHHREPMLVLEGIALLSGYETVQ